MKKIAIILIAILALTSCKGLKKYDVQVQYFNERVDTVIVLSEMTPILTAEGGLMSTSNSIYGPDKVEIAGVRKIRILKVKDL